MRTRGITIYQETLIPRKKIQWYCTRGSNSDTAKRLGGLACWWPHWNPSMSWKFRLYVLETPWFYVYPSRGIQIHWKTKAQIAVNWYHWPTFILPIQTHQIAAVQRQPTYFFLVGALEHVLWLSIQLGMYGMSSSQLTNSIIFPDGYCTINQIIINHH